MATTECKVNSTRSQVYRSVATSLSECTIALFRQVSAVANRTDDLLNTSADYHKRRGTCLEERPVRSYVSNSQVGFTIDLV